jgi:hypothetical protein
MRTRIRIILYRHNLDGAGQTPQRIAAGRGPEFVRNVSGVAEVGDGLGDEMVVELLRIVDFVAPGHAACMEVSDPLQVLLNIEANITIHDLHVVDIEQKLDARRVDSHAHVDAPREVIADLVQPPKSIRREFAVHYFETDVHSLFLGMGLEAVEISHNNVRPLFVRNAAALATDRDHVQDVVGRAQVDGLVHERFDTRMEFPADNPVINAIPVARGGGWNQTILAQRRPVGWFDEIETLAAGAHSRAAHVVH